jgi:parallel beta-helix repeat protein
VVNNMCNNNDIGISLNSALTVYVDSEGVVRGMQWEESLSNTVTNNICNDNEVGIRLNGSSYNTVENNTCNRNDIGIFLDRKMELNPFNNLTYWIDSHSNTVADNTCNNNRIGIYIYTLGTNTVADNTCLGNVEHDIVDESELKEELAHKEFVARESVWFLAGCGMILVVSVIALVQFRRMEMDHEVVDTHAYF